MKLLLSLLIVCLLATSVMGDCYMQNPRGSNDRLNEENTNRDNANRLCDTQNNGKGGYCWGPPMYFYEGSLLSIEWTVQHGCGNPKVSCNIVLQYMCSQPDEGGDTIIRDGTTTTTIPNETPTYMETDANGDYVYGMHENWEYYQWCQTRLRNSGLWISDRNVGGRAVNTRQNNGGNRHGFECPEERDHYPYWHPAPWKDIAVIIDNEDFCDFYQTESQNVKEKCFCWNPETDFYSEFNNEVECGANGQDWQCQDSWGLSAPDCVLNTFSRDNHLGNGIAGHTAQYNWTMPSLSDACDAEECLCVLRIRYNMSSFDYDNDPDGSFTDYTYNAEASPVTENPIVEQNEQGLRLAIDTSQFFRTFEDRSHVFSIRERPSSIPADSRIYNLNVRGKRGNIVETYPATEYDFIPGNLDIRVRDYVHFQWTGCDTNPQGNAGEGRAGTDRSNVVQIEDESQSLPVDDDWLKENTPLFDDKKLRQRLAYLGQTDCPTYEELLADNDNNENQADQDVRNCYKLNAAPAYFDGGAVKMNATGTFYYMSTRNNNFSNRDQKGTITVSRVLDDWAIGVVAAGGALFLASVAVAGGMFYARSHPHSGVARIFNKM